MDKLNKDQIKFLELLQPFYDLLNEIGQENITEFIKWNSEYEIIQLKQYYKNNYLDLPNNNWYKIQVCYLMNLFNIRFENISINL
jgi:hypothetical protein